MYLWLRFSPKVAQVFVREKVLDSPDRLQFLADNNADDICNVMRKPGGKNVNGLPDRRQQVLVIAQENLKLAFFLFHNMYWFSFDWEVIGVSEDTVCLQKRLKDDGKDPNALPKVNKPGMTCTMEAIKEYLRLNCGVISSPLVYIIRMTIIVQIYGDFPRYMTASRQE